MFLSFPRCDECIQFQCGSISRAFDIHNLHWYNEMNETLQQDFKVATSIYIHNLELLCQTQS